MSDDIPKIIKPVNRIGGVPANGMWRDEAPPSRNERRLAKKRGDHNIPPGVPPTAFHFRRQLLELVEKQAAQPADKLAALTWVLGLVAGRLTQPGLEEQMREQLTTQLSLVLENQWKAR